MIPCTGSTITDDTWDNGQACTECGHRMDSHAHHPEHRVTCDICHVLDTIMYHPHAGPKALV